MITENMKIKTASDANWLAGEILEGFEDQGDKQALSYYIWSNFAGKKMQLAMDSIDTDTLYEIIYT